MKNVYLIIMFAGMLHASNIFASNCGDIQELHNQEYDAEMVFDSSDDEDGRQEYDDFTITREVPRHHASRLVIDKNFENTLSYTILVQRAKARRREINANHAEWLHESFRSIGIADQDAF